MEKPTLIWTHIVKAAALIFLFIFVAGSFFMYGKLSEYTYDEMEQYLLVVTIAYCLIILVGVSVVLMIAEISTNIYKLSRIVYNQNSFVPATIVQNMPQPVNTSNSVSRTWTCSCGSQNESEAAFCRNCGKQKNTM